MISNFSAQLAPRPDGDRVRSRLAAEFFVRPDDLWPRGVPDAVSPGWLKDHVDELLAPIDRLWNEAACPPQATESLDRLSWLPPLIDDLEWGKARLASRCEGVSDDLRAYAGFSAKRIVEDDYEANGQTDRRHVHHVDLCPERFLVLAPAEKGSGHDKKKKNDPEVVRDVRLM